MGEVNFMTEIFVISYVMCLALIVAALFYFGLSYEKRDKKKPSP